VKSEIRNLIALALKEDIGFGDITTKAIVKEGRHAKASIICKEDLVVSGLDIAQQVFEALGDLDAWKAKKSNGDTCLKGDVLVKLEGDTAHLLSAERTALNFLQHMSGIATVTSRFAKVLEKTDILIVDTRKTTPGMRTLEKRAVRHGGGRNHRIGLYDQYLIKNNHIDIVGGVAKAIKKVKNRREDDKPIEVEVRNLAELKEALAEGVDIVMLDNWPVQKLDAAIEKIEGRCKIEVSGGITLDNIKEYARPGIDFISVGAITHSAPAVDISMKISKFS